MIPVTLSTLIFIYLFAFLAFVFFVWMRAGLRRRRHENESLQFRLRCSMCHFEFEDRTDETLPRCPRCGTLNERARFRRL